MKLALQMTGELAQVSLTPEDDAEKAILALLHAKPRTVTIEQGQVLAECRGGYLRHFDERPNRQATVLVLREAPPTAPTAERIIYTDDPMVSA